MLAKTGIIVAGVALGALSACTPRAPEGPGAFAARAPVNIGPGSAPAVVGTYDFDMLGEAQGAACAEWGPRGPEGFRMIYVNGRPASYSAAVAGATFESADPRIQQAEAAAVFTALGRLSGADLMFVTRSIVQSESAERVCATVWGQVVRLKKGPTLVPSPPAPDGVAHGAQAPSVPAAPPAATPLEGAAPAK